jgi:hypothetical protein
MNSNLLSKRNKIKLFKKTENKFFSFNPTVFKYNNKIYALTRNETNVFHFYNSIISYSILKLDANLNVIYEKIINYNINNIHYENIMRPNINNIPIIEDIKLYTKYINNKIIGVCNVLLNNSKFCVGIVQIDIENNLINLLNIFNIDNMKHQEKNWLLFEHNNKFLFIYQLFPSLIIYELDINTYKITKFYEKYTFDILSNFIKDDLFKTYINLYLTPCSNIIELTKNKYIIISKKRTNKNIYEYYYIILTVIDDIFDIYFINNKIIEGPKLFLNDIKVVNNKFIECWGINDQDYRIKYNKIQINLLYNETNYDNQIYKFIIKKLINHDKYQLIFNQQNIPINIKFNLFIENINENSFIFNYGEKFKNPLLLLSKLYEPKLINVLKNKIGIISDLTDKYNNLDNNIYYLINQSNDWENMINSIYSCKYIISSLLIGLICADTYNKNNIWLDENKNDIDFKDYFTSQNREYINIKNISEFDEKLLYTDGNKINLDNLINEFPFK